MLAIYMFRCNSFLRILFFFSLKNFKLEFFLFPYRFSETVCSNYPSQTVFGLFTMESERFALMKFEGWPWKVALVASTMRT